MNQRIIEEALFELYLEDVDNDVQKIERNSHPEHREAVLAEMRSKYKSLLHDSNVLAPTELDMLHWIIE